MSTRARDLETLPPTSDGAARDTRRALEVLLAPFTPREFAVRLWNGETLAPSPGCEARFVLVLAHPASLLRMFWPPGELTSVLMKIQ